MESWCNGISEKMYKLFSSDKNFQEDSEEPYATVV